MIRMIILAVALLGVGSPGQTRPTVRALAQPAPVPPGSPVAGQTRFEDLSPAEQNEFRAAYIARRNLPSTSVSSECRKIRDEGDRSASGLERATNNLKCSANGY